MVARLTLAVAVCAAKRVQHIGVSPRCESSVIKGTDNVTVTRRGSSRRRSLRAPALGPPLEANSGRHQRCRDRPGVSEGGANRGQFEITGKASKTIRSTAASSSEAVGRKRGDRRPGERSASARSVAFPEEFNPPTASARLPVVPWSEGLAPRYARAVGFQATTGSMMNSRSSTSRYGMTVVLAGFRSSPLVGRVADLLERHGRRRGGCVRRPSNDAGSTDCAPDA